MFYKAVVMAILLEVVMALKIFSGGDGILFGCGDDTLIGGGDTLTGGGVGEV